MLEPDVLFDFPDVAEVLALFNGARHDLIAPKFGHRPQSWGWHKAKAEDGQPVFGISVQFIRPSARAVAALHRARAEASSAPVTRSGPHGPITNRLLPQRSRDSALSAPIQTRFQRPRCGIGTRSALAVPCCSMNVRSGADPACSTIPSLRAPFF